MKEASEGEIKIEKMVLDVNGKPQPTGEFETIAADSLVLALGQQTDLGLLTGVKGLTVEKDEVIVDPVTFMTGADGVFAGGDMIPGDKNVTAAIGHGKKAARSINAWLPKKPRLRRLSRGFTPGTTRMLRRPCVRCWTSCAARRRLTKCSGV